MHNASCRGASADLLTIEVDGIADPAFGSFSDQLFLDTDTGALTGQTVLPQLFNATIDFNGSFGGEGTSGETSQGSVTGPSYQGIGTLTVPFTGQFDWNFDVVFGSGVSLGDAGLGVVNLQGFDPINMGPLDANLELQLQRCSCSRCNRSARSPPASAAVAAAEPLWF